MYRYKLFALVFPLGLSILLSGCSSATTKVSLPVMDKTAPAEVYLYRPLLLANSMVTPRVLLNGHAVDKISNGGFIRIPVALNTQIVSLDLGKQYLGDKSLSLQVRLRQRYFVRVNSSLTFQMNKPYLRYFNLQLVDEKTALKEMHSMLKDTAEKTQPAMLPDDQQVTDDESPEEDHFSMSKSRNPFSR